MRKRLFSGLMGFGFRSNCGMMPVEDGDEKPDVSGKG